MRVLMVSSYYPPHTGGVENYVRNLARTVAKIQGHEVSVVSTERRLAKPAVRRDGRVTVYLLPAKWQVSNTVMDPRWVGQLRRLVRRIRPDVMNIHAPVPGLSDIAARVSDTPMILTYHTGPMRKGRPLIDLALATYERMVLSGTARRASRVVVSSSWVASSLASIIGERVTVLSPGFDDAIFRRGVEEPKLGRLAFVGSLEQAHAYKGLRSLIESMPQVRSAHPEVTLDVVGDGDGAADYQRLAARLGVADIVRFHGRREGLDLAAAYRSCQALVLPTTFDSFPTVLVESLACGRPVVSTTVGGVPEAVRDGIDGWLIPSGDSTALVGTLKEVVSDPEECARRGALGAARVTSQTWDAVAGSMLELFHSAVTSGARRP